MLLYIMKNICDWNNCNEIGEYKAPTKIIVENLECFALNMSKNLTRIGTISGMNDDQVMDLKSDMTWHKPTQALPSANFKVLWNTTLKDELDKEKINGDFYHMSIWIIKI